MAKSELDKLAESKSLDYLQRSAKSFSEAGIHLMMTCMTVKSVILFLEKQIEFLKEFSKD